MKSTKHFALRIKPESKNLKVKASADASYAPFKDGKSNTGFVIVLGGERNAPVMSKSGKQKSVTNSSSAAELFAAAQALEEVLWVAELLNEMGFKQDAIILEQDNQSTMKLLEKGPSSTGRTKWINVKHFWVKQYVENGKVKLKYVPSLELLADGFTKPLAKKTFFRWRARVLNHGDCDSEVQGMSQNESTEVYHGTKRE